MGEETKTTTRTAPRRKEKARIFTPPPPPRTWRNSSSSNSGLLWMTTISTTTTKEEALLCISANEAPKMKSVFHQRASRVGHAIHSTSQKLDRLAQLAKRSGAFDDSSQEINTISFAVKEDIKQLNTAIAELQQLALHERAKDETVDATFGDDRGEFERTVDGRDQGV